MLMLPKKFSCMLASSERITPYTFIVTTIVLILLLGCDRRNADDHLAIAWKLEEAGNIDSAGYHIDKALEKDPMHVGARIGHGVLLLQNGDNTGAILDYTFVIKRDSANILAWCERAVAKSRQGDYTGAYKDLWKATELKAPGSGLGQREMMIYETVDNPAIGIRRDPFDVHYVDIAYWRALNYLDLDSVAKAYDLLNYCIEQEHEVAECSYSRGVILITNDRLPDGCADLERAALLHHAEATRAWNKYCVTK